jgi:hypothetical protein
MGTVSTGTGSHRAPPPASGSVPRRPPDPTGAAFLPPPMRSHSRGVHRAQKQASWPTRQARRGRWILGRASSARAACRGQLDSFLTNGFNKCLRRSNLPKTRFGIKKPLYTDFIKNQKTSRFFIENPISKIWGKMVYQAVKNRSIFLINYSVF